MNRTDLQSLSAARLAEAKALLASGHAAGAYYLAGYAIECGLKACIAKRTEQHDFPDKRRTLDAWTHELEALVTCAGLAPQLEERRGTSPQFAEHWTVLKDWKEDARYRIAITPEAASDLIRAIDANPDGALAWIRSQW